MRCVRLWHWFIRHLVWIATGLLAAALLSVIGLPLVLDWMGKVRQIEPGELSSWLQFCDRWNGMLIDGLMGVWIFALGASFASFLNVVAYRLPRGKSILGRSHCPICQSQLSFAENFPILGWVTSRGRCRHCRIPIPPRYLLVEIILGSIFLGLYLVDIRSEVSPRAALMFVDSGAMATALLRFASHATLLGILLTAVLSRLDNAPLPLGVVAAGGLLNLVWGILAAKLGASEFPWSQVQLAGLAIGLGLGWMWGRTEAPDGRGSWIGTWGLAGWVLGDWLIPLAVGLAALACGTANRVVRTGIPSAWSHLMQLNSCMLIILVAEMLTPVGSAPPIWLCVLNGAAAAALIFWNQLGLRNRAHVLTLVSIIAVAGLGTRAASGFQEPAEPAPDVKLARQQFQAQELIPSRFGGWIFQINAPPRIIWRDVDEVRRLARDVDFQVRWFDADLNEFPVPQAAGRWMAWLEGTAPNGLPFRRALTFYALPEKLDLGAAPDLSVTFPNFPGPHAAPAWSEHRDEIEKAARDFVTRAFLDSERGAILVAGITESPTRGRPCRYVESTTVVNDEHHLRLKLKLQGLGERVRPLQPPRPRTIPATVLRDASPQEAGVPASAKTRIDAFCREWNAATGVPFVTLVARRGVIITHEAFGKDAQGVAVSTDYRCWIASLTKTVTAILFSQFVDQGRIGLDAPLSSVFPDFPVDSPHVPTFRQCLNHTSGLAGHGEHGGMHNPHLENIVLNGIDVVEPGKAHAYSGLGFELAAKAMEVVAGKCATRVYDEHLFQPLGFGDVVLGNASSDAELTARELATLGQWIANGGSYGDREFVSPETWAQFLPQPLEVPGATVEQGLGLHAVYHRRLGADANSKRPEDLLFSPRTVGHGSFSGCILVVDPDQQLVIAQVRREFKQADNDWYPKFFQTIAAAIADE